MIIVREYVLCKKESTTTKNKTCYFVILHKITLNQFFFRTLGCIASIINSKCSFVSTRVRFEFGFIGVAVDDLHFCVTFLQRKKNHIFFNSFHEKISFNPKTKQSHENVKNIYCIEQTMNSKIIALHLIFRSTLIVSKKNSQILNHTNRIISTLYAI